MSRQKKADRRQAGHNDQQRLDWDDDFFDYQRDNAGQIPGRKRRDMHHKQSHHRARQRDHPTDGSSFHQ